MEIKDIFDKVKLIITTPEQFWSENKENNVHLINTLKNFLVPLVILWFVTLFIGNFFFGSNESLLYIISQNLTVIFSCIAWIIVTIYLYREIAVRFNINNNINRCADTIIYSFTPVILSEIIAAIHYNLGFIHIFGLYSVYIFWKAFEREGELSKDKRTAIVVVTFIIAIVTGLLIRLIFNGAFSMFYESSNLFVS